MRRSQIIRHSLRGALAGAALVVLVLCNSGAPMPTDTLQPTETVVPGSPVALIEAHDCWTSNGPAGVIPGHVVVTLPGHVAPTYGGRKLTSDALEQLFDGRDHGLGIHAFCR